MALAPLFFLRAGQPSRRSNWDQAIVALPDSANRTFEFHFEWQRGLFVNVQHFPAAAFPDAQQNKGDGEKDTLYYPPPHYHLFADEYFLVTQGAGTWHLWDRDVRLAAGDKVKVPARAWHWFEGDPSPDRPLATEIYFDKGDAVMEERFFRNVLGYLADCHREEVEPSICQLLLFFYSFEMVPGLRIARWETLNLVLNTAIMYVGSAIGMLLGYRSSYDEYYKAQKKSQ
ncbi:Cupin, RmlC-type [Akanthomyces lecanii RCEF 1005]|uniref:Cupin, RmlC-type n=1 Tax=Akanthomyces lecanii RCEF 1005 TaxID=1081108 RepID=A0A162K6J3_CORDF|nr:Cupin, RmlC-type [Akanthomyces lecanii RCEF 1005]